LLQRWDLMHNCWRSKDYIANCCNRLPTLSVHWTTLRFLNQTDVSYLYFHTVVWCPVIEWNQ
jgi:hypothetical protein